MRGQWQEDSPPACAGEIEQPAGVHVEGVSFTPERRTSTRPPSRLLMRGCFVPTISAKVFWGESFGGAHFEAGCPSRQTGAGQGSLRAIFSFCSSRSYRKRNGAQNPSRHPAITMQRLFDERAAYAWPPRSPPLEICCLSVNFPVMAIAARVTL